jgi:hypothetical protein
MKNFIYLSIVGVAVGCSTDKNTTHPISADYTFVITDSIRVQHLEELKLIDFHEGKFLAKKGLFHYMIFDESGKIISDIELKTDGPDAINMPYSAGYFDGKFTIMDLHLGLVQFSNNGELTNTIPIPKDYIYMHLYNRPAFKLGNKIAIYRPERDLKDWEDQEKFYRKYYNEPLLEVIDTVSAEVTLQMEIPGNSIYKDGNFHFLYHPKIVKQGKLWYLMVLAEMKFFVYEELGDKLTFKKSVSLPIQDNVPFPIVSLQNSPELFLKLELIVPSTIEQLYAIDDKIILVYKKGATEAVVKNHDRENEADWLDFFESLPTYAAVFDSDHNLLQTDIEMPSGTIPTPIVNQKGQIVVQKNQRLLGEEDWNTYYLLDFIDKN